MRVDDLAPLLAQEPPAGVGLRQGTILAWDPVTAENTVDVGGTAVTNLAVLNTSEALLIKPGDVVNILTTGEGMQSWGILGRIIIPGTAQAASALSVVANQITAASNATFGSTASSSYTPTLSGGGSGPSVTATIRATGKAVVWWGCDFGFTGAFETAAGAGVSIAVSGATSIAASASWALGFALQMGGGSISFSTSGSQFQTFTGLNPGSTTFEMQYRDTGNSSGNAVSFGERRLAVLAL